MSAVGRKGALASAALSAGFVTIERKDYRRSHDLRLAQDRDVQAPYSLYVEAIR